MKLTTKWIAIGIIALMAAGCTSAGTRTDRGASSGSMNTQQPESGE